MIFRDIYNALVRPIYTKKDKQNKESYRLVSILNGFLKAYERFINDNMLPIMQTFLSNFVWAYRKNYIANHVLPNMSNSQLEKEPRQ